jgi:2-amino-4-hydroxy-6-hydroxymethyldihydropteridine diphosphokinase
VRAGIALGSNVGDRLANLRSARAEIARLASGGEVVASSIYETEPVDCEPDAPPFYNAVVEIDYASSALELLHELGAIEERLGRPANHARNVSRTIDLDLLYLDDEELDRPELRLPHPRLHERRFVLAPLAEIRPHFGLPKQSASIAELLARLPASPRVVRASQQW